MVQIVKNPGNGRLNNLNGPNRPECVNMLLKFALFSPVEKCNVRTRLNVKRLF